MITKRFLLKIITISLVLGMMVVGYVDGSTAEDYIKITSVTPNRNLIDGAVQEFVVTVEYALSTKEQGIIYIGFNNSSPNRYTLVRLTPSMTGFVVNRGRGSLTFTVRATTKNWHPNGRFRVYANISPYPHENSWNPLAYDIVPLSF